MPVQHNPRRWQSIESHDFPSGHAAAAMAHRERFRLFSSSSLSLVCSNFPDSYRQSWWRMGHHVASACVRILLRSALHDLLLLVITIARRVHFVFWAVPVWVVLIVFDNVARGKRLGHLLRRKHVCHDLLLSHEEISNGTFQDFDWETITFSVSLSVRLIKIWPFTSYVGHRIENSETITLMLRKS